MKTVLTIHAETLLKSTLTPDQFILLLLLQKKDFKAVEKLVLRLYGYPDHYLGEVYYVLEEDGWIKINGDKLPQDIEVRQKFLELIADEKSVNVDEWVDEYRGLFKGKKEGALGDKEMCKKHLIWLLTSYPEYNKEDILKAAKHYISSCAKEGYKYLMKSHYFLSKEDSSGTASHAILTYLEEIKDPSFVETSDFTTSI